MASAPEPPGVEIQDATEDTGGTRVNVRITSPDTIDHTPIKNGGTQPDEKRNETPEVSLTNPPPKTPKAFLDRLTIPTTILSTPVRSPSAPLPMDSGYKSAVMGKIRFYNDISNATPAQLREHIGLLNEKLNAAREEGVKRVKDVEIAELENAAQKGRLEEEIAELKERVREMEERLEEKQMEFDIVVLAMDQKLYEAAASDSMETKDGDIVGLRERVEELEGRIEEMRLEHEITIWEMKEKLDEAVMGRDGEIAGLKERVAELGRTIEEMAMEHEIVYSEFQKRLTSAGATKDGQDLSVLLEAQIRKTAQRDEDILNFEKALQIAQADLQAALAQSSAYEAETKALKNRIDKVRREEQDKLAAYLLDLETAHAELRDRLETCELEKKDRENDVLLLERDVKAAGEAEEVGKMKAKQQWDVRNELVMVRAEKEALERQLEDEHRGLEDTTETGEMLWKAELERREMEWTARVAALEGKVAMMQIEREDEESVSEMLRREKLRANTLQRQVDFIGQKDLEIKIMQKRLQVLERDVVDAQNSNFAQPMPKLDKQDKVKWNMHRFYQALELQKAFTRLPDLSVMPPPEDEDEKIRELEGLQDEAWTLRALSLWMGWGGDGAKSKKQRFRERKERKEKGKYTRGTVERKDEMRIDDLLWLASVLEQGKSLPSTLVTLPNGELAIDYSVLGWKVPELDRLDLRDLGRG